MSPSNHLISPAVTVFTLKISNGQREVSATIITVVFVRSRGPSKIYKAVSSGWVSENLGNRSPGSLNHARWLTTASRISRLYLSKFHSEKHLVTLVNFVMKVNFPISSLKLRQNLMLLLGPQQSEEVKKNS